MEHNNYFGTAWAALGMTAYYLALVWINTLLGLFLSPLFLIPMTWLQERVAGRRGAPAVATGQTVTARPAAPVAR